MALSVLKCFQTLCHRRSGSHFTRKCKRCVLVNFVAAIPNPVTNVRWRCFALKIMSAVWPSLFIHSFSTQQKKKWRPSSKQESKLQLFEWPVISALMRMHYQETLALSWWPVANSLGTDGCAILVVLSSLTKLKFIDPEIATFSITQVLVHQLWQEFIVGKGVTEKHFFGIAVCLGNFKYLHCKK